ncbi:antiviral reverse transcriptase Drt3a [Phytopseudomonas daroniae]|uniref:antiviral reverse transcriptase Drt3a n=1 Tax=Phytopseudomonas daroniae TaxID=2487519 RepID=UPI0010383F47|nr:antiviral reverse transcriptase Drt3a [Pseudomonas daroniae]TBU78701.1 reverse transcriptase [Pseudomonas daroniae]
MANQAFSTSSLARCLFKADFYDDPRISDDDYRKSVISYALQIAQNPTETPPAIKQIKISNKTGYTAGNLASKMVLRRCNKNINKAYNITPKNRQSISRELPAYLRDGTKYKVYRLDIKSFFENIPANILLNIIDSSEKLSCQTKFIIRSHIEDFKKRYGSGIPRGVETSPSLSELLLSEYDKKVTSHDEVFYYSRFVDDILIITSSNENEDEFYKWLCDLLPLPLEYNSTKTQIYPVPRRKKAGTANPNGKLVLSFDFLGYSYKVYDTPLPLKDGVENSKTATSIYRKVCIDIEEKKIRKIKEKICKAIYSFSKNKDFELLFDRVSFLTSNRELKNKSGGRKVPTGIYYNYASIDTQAGGLNNLDKFLMSTLTGKFGRLQKTYSSHITSEHKSKLLKLSFSQGFEKRAHRKFSPNRLKEITRIWL